MKLSLLGAVLLAPAAFAQSSSSAGSSMMSSSMASASASSSASSGGSSSNSSSSTQAYLTQVLGALTAANLTSLVGVASTIANTSNGMALLSMLASGNKTVFAPNNAAFANVSSSVASNPDLLTQVLAYHILNSTYSYNTTATYPNHTIARTMLNGGNFTLPGNKSAPLVLSHMSSMMSNSSSNSTSNSTSSSSSMMSIMINQAYNNITTLASASAANLMIYVIDQVIMLPQSLSELAMNLFPTLAGVISQVGLLQPLEQAKGITVFAPCNASLNAAISSLPQNMTLIQTILANHVINGSVVYSTGLMNANYTSAAGEPFTFMSNSSGTYVMSANSTAKIIQADIIIENGVVHVIDNVLVNTMSNATAASNAYSSGIAAASTADTGAQTSAASASGSSTSKSAAGSVTPFAFTNSMVGTLVAVAGVVVGGGYILA